MGQFKPKKEVALAVLSASSPLISTVLHAVSSCGTYSLSVDFSVYEDMIRSQLIIEDLHPGGLLLINTTPLAYTLQVADHRGDRLLAAYGSDIGYSGYAMLHSVLGDQEAIDMADARQLKVMRVFVSSLRVMTCCLPLIEELDCIISYMNGFEGCCSRSLPETRGLWLSPPDIRQIAGTDNIFIWVYEPGRRMDYISAEKVSLSCVLGLGCMDHVVSHRRMYRGFLPLSQHDLSPLLSALANQACSYLRAYQASSLSATTI
jgi:hypothetical protein